MQGWLQGILLLQDDAKKNPTTACIPLLVKGCNSQGMPQLCSPHLAAEPSAHPATPHPCMLEALQSRNPTPCSPTALQPHSPSQRCSFGRLLGELHAWQRRDSRSEGTAAPCVGSASRNLQPLSFRQVHVEDVPNQCHKNLSRGRVGAERGLTPLPPRAPRPTPLFMTRTRPVLIAETFFVSQ